MGNGWITEVTIFSVQCNMCNAEEVFSTGRSGRVMAERYVVHTLGWRKKYVRMGYLCPPCSEQWRVMSPRERDQWLQDHNQWPQCHKKPALRSVNVRDGLAE